jgi:cytoskeletal protein RodZ
VSATEINQQEHPANSPGVILRRCREYHGITLEEASEATKIGMDHLTALERDQVKETASLAYRKGFLRIYAAYLGLNADDMVRLYEKLHAPPAAPDRRAPASDAGIAKRRFPWKKLILPVVLLLLLIVTSSILNRSAAPPPHQQQAASPETATIPAAAPVQPIISSAGTVHHPPKDTNPAVPVATPEKPELLPANPDAAPLPATVAKGFVVRMSVIHNATLTVTIDGAAPQDYDLSVGDVIEWKAHKSITLVLSNAGGVDIELNGRHLKPLGPEGSPVYVTLDANGVKS